MTEAGVAGHGQRQQTDDERQQREEHHVATVGHQEPYLAACDRRYLSPHTGTCRCQLSAPADPDSGVERCESLGPVGALLPARNRRCDAVGIGADDAEDVGPVGGPDRRLELVEAVRRMRSCRRVRAAAPDRRRPGTSTNASPPRRRGRRRRAWRSIAITLRSSAGSSPVVGSSSTSSDGPVNSSNATDTRLRCPPDKLSMRVEACGVNSSSSSTCGDHLPAIARRWCRRASEVPLRIPVPARR